MTTRYGNPEVIKKKYATDITTKSNKKFNLTKANPVNKEASYNKPTLKITLPSEPSLRVTHIPLEKEIEMIPTTTLSTDTYKYNLLNFIDIVKLIEGRPGFKGKSYFLEDLKHLATLLNLFKNEKPKRYFIDVIIEEMTNAFGKEPNLIADVKMLKVDEIKKIKYIENLFTKHHISEPTKTNVINNIKMIIKKYYTSDDLIRQVINQIENEWKPQKK